MRKSGAKPSPGLLAAIDAAARRRNRRQLPARWHPKGLREHLCQQATCAPDNETKAAINALIAVLDRHRPLGPDGKHGTQHTPTCGCEDT
jgi:hypothetical protein